MAKPIRYRMVDVGRPGHHYLEVAVYKQAGPKGGHTKGHLITAAEMKARALHMLKSRRK